ncbi:MalY/PatB family protein [Epidermidibacterium keratini]|nr:aminotransferase class I/II-fold pyridoxal phosphate-dependent enzyme [Epidermidibacterium keratini]
MQEPTLEQLRRIGGLKWSRYPDQIGAWVAEMDFGVAPEVAAALHAAVDDGLLGYLPPALDQRLREATAQWHADQYGWDVSPQRVRLLPDVIRGFEEAMETFSEPGTPIVLPTPAYMPFLTVPGLHDRELIELPMVREAGGWRLDLDDLDAALAGGGLLVMCNPHNPIGKVYTAEEMQAISEVVQRRGARVFSDEIHAPLVYAGARHVPYATVSEAAAAHTVTATSASKAWNLPGLKCAQLLFSNAADLARFDDAGWWASHGTSTVGVIANTAAYAEGKPWLDDVMAYVAGNRAALGTMLEELLPEVGYRQPEGTYLAWLDCRQLDLADPYAFFAEQAGVQLTDGLQCGAAGAGHVRLNFAMPRALLEQAVEAMADALRRRSA